MIDSTATIADFLNAAAAKQPTPGGGAVAALAGALAASMGEMVLAYSVGKKDLAVHAPANQSAMRELSVARSILVQLMREDQDAYQAYSDAKKANASPEAMQELLNACVGVPQSIGTTALAILEIANRVVSTSNRWLLSDLAVCGELAMATVRCAIHNVLVNVGEIADAGQQNRLRADCDQLLARGVGEINRLIPAIRAAQG